MKSKLLNMVYHKAPSKDPYYFSYIYIYINDLSRSIKNSKLNYFADDENLLYASTSLKDINKKINFDLSNPFQWLNSSSFLVSKKLNN